MTAPALSAVEPPAEPVELAAPRQHDWDDGPRTCARDDDRYWDNRYDRDED